MIHLRTTTEKHCVVSALKEWKCGNITYFKQLKIWRVIAHSIISATRD